MITVLVRKMTGRIPLLPVAEQGEVYSLIETEYRDYVEQKEAMGESLLQAGQLDLDARTIARMEVVADSGDVQSEFSGPVHLEIIDAKSQSKPLSQLQVANLTSQSLNLEPVGKLAEVDWTSISDAGSERSREQLKQLEALTQQYRSAKVAQLESGRAAAEKGLKEGESSPIDERITKLNEKLDYQIWQVGKALNEFPPGTTVRIVRGDNEKNADVFYGVVTGIEHKDRPGSPATPSSWHLKLALANGEVKSLNVPVSAVNTEPGRRGGSFRVDKFETDIWSGKPIYELFDAQQGDIRQERQMLTGNIVRAWDKFSAGKITNFTDHQGRIRQGVLLPKSFDMGQRLENEPVVFKEPGQVREFIEDTTEGFGSVKTMDGILTIRKQRGEYVLATPRAKASGGKYYLDKDLIDRAGGDFVGSGEYMRVTVPLERMENTLLYLMSSEKLACHDPNFLKKARDQMGIKMPEMEHAPEGGVLEVDDFVIDGNVVPYVEEPTATDIGKLEDLFQGESASRNPEENKPSDSEWVKLSDEQMNRHEFKRGDLIISVGWDSPLDTYFATLENLQADPEDMPPIWIGSLPGEYRDLQALTIALNKVLTKKDIKDFQLPEETLERLQASHDRNPPGAGMGRKTEEIRDFLNFQPNSAFAPGRAEAEGFLEIQPVNSSSNESPQLEPEAASSIKFPEAYPPLSKASVEKNIAKFLHEAGLAEQVMQGEGFHLRINNEPYIPLVVEAHDVGGGDRQLFLTHYREQNGDLILDTEMVFNLTKDGYLGLDQVAVEDPIRGGEHRTYDGGERNFAKLFSKNILAQGFAEAAREMTQVVPSSETESTVPKRPDFQELYARANELLENELPQPEAVANLSKDWEEIRGTVTEEYGGLLDDRIYDLEARVRRASLDQEISLSDPSRETGTLGLDEPPQPAEQSTTTSPTFDSSVPVDQAPIDAGAELPPLIEKFLNDSGLTTIVENSSEPIDLSVENGDKAPLAISIDNTVSPTEINFSTALELPNGKRIGAFMEYLVGEDDLSLTVTSWGGIWDGGGGDPRFAKEFTQALFDQGFADAIKNQLATEYGLNAPEGKQDSLLEQIDDVISDFDQGLERAKHLAGEVQAMAEGLEEAAGDLGARTQLERLNMGITHPVQPQQSSSEPQLNQDELLGTLRSWYRHARAIGRSPEHLAKIEAIGKAVAVGQLDAYGPRDMAAHHKDEVAWTGMTDKFIAQAIEILERDGEPDPSGARVVEGKNYALKTDGESLSINSRDRGQILLIKDNQLTYSNVDFLDVERFALKLEQQVETVAVNAEYEQ